MELRSKVWLLHNGKMVFGKGRAELLEAIGRTGSISAAARELELSYRHAWTMIRASEKRLGLTLLRRTKGGSGGGGATLTGEARALLSRYREAETKIRSLAGEMAVEF